MSAQPLRKFTRFVFATALSRELIWALLIKTAALVLIGWLFFRDTAPPATIEKIGNHVLSTISSPSRPASTFSEGEPHGFGNRR